MLHYGLLRSLQHLSFICLSWWRVTTADIGAVSCLIRNWSLETALLLQSWDSQFCCICTLVTPFKSAWKTADSVPPWKRRGGFAVWHGVWLLLLQSAFLSQVWNILLLFQDTFQTCWTQTVEIVFLSSKILGKSWLHEERPGPSPFTTIPKLRQPGKLCSSTGSF